ncbi:MAG: metallopeptidase family protein, partial [bacterium]
ELAIAELPEEFRNYFTNIAIIVEDYPTPEDVESTGVPKKELLGMFRGSSYPEKPGLLDVPQSLPDEIALFKKNIERVCSSEDELIEEVRLTLLHEVGHYFGLSEEELEQYE